MATAQFWQECKAQSAADEARSAKPGLVNASLDDDHDDEPRIKELDDDHEHDDYIVRKLEWRGPIAGDIVVPSELWPRRQQLALM